MHQVAATYVLMHKHICMQVMEEVEGKEGTSIMDAVLERLVKVVVCAYMYI